MSDPMQFSANLGFLWTNYDLPKAVQAASEAGFSAVEFHYPYNADRSVLRKALDGCGIPLMSLNTHRGGDGLNGLAALPGYQAKARARIDQAIEWAGYLGAENVHVMAGNADGCMALAQYLNNLRYAADRAGEAGVKILIEPLNSADAPGYFLNNLAQAVNILDSLNLSNVKLMFDCYHVSRTEGDVEYWFDRVREFVGHVQFASKGARQEPDQACMDALRHIVSTGWSKPMGAEYRPSTSQVEQSLDWMDQLQAHQQSA